jgi:hypothetical protein
MPGSLPLFTKIVLFPLQPAHSQEARAGFRQQDRFAFKLVLSCHVLVSKKKRIQTDAEDLVYLYKAEKSKAPELRVPLLIGQKIRWTHRATRSTATIDESGLGIVLEVD